MKRLVIATRNKKKLLELQAILEGLPCQVETLDAHPQAPEVEETGTTFEENACLKAVTVAKALGAWVLADDSGLEVDALGGAPGVYSARYSGAHATDASNRAKLLDALEALPNAARTARFVCVIAVSSPEGEVFVTRGTCEGRIARAEQGDGGFGYDPLFWLEGLGMTMAELTPEAKHRISHRGKALRKVREWLHDRS